MTLVRGRVLRGLSESAPYDTTHTAITFAARRVPRELVQAKDEARAILKDAERRAEELLARAAADAKRLEANAVAQGRADGLAETAALALALRAREDRADEAALDRTSALARLLAERLVGEALNASDDTVLRLARGVLSEARGARRILLRAHPEDARVLEAATSAFDPDGRVHAVTSDPSLGRGDLVLETEVGLVDARLGAGLDRLTARLREALRP